MATKPSNQVLRSVTERVVDSFTSLGMLFTGLDISNSVKTSLPEVRHREIAPIVRELFENGAMGDYEQTLIDVVANGGKAAQAYLYHLPEQDPTMYDDRMRAQLAIPPVSTSIATSDDPNIGPGTLEAIVNVGLDGRGRVPRQLVANAGINDSSVRLVASTGRIVLSAPSSTDVDSADGMEMTLASEHPTLIQIPRKHMAVFTPGTKLLAHVMGNIVEVVPAP